MGTVIIPKEVMTEKEVREFLPQIVQDPEMNEVWKAKAEKDPIEDLISWLQQAGYSVKEV